MTVGRVTFSQAPVPWKAIESVKQASIQCGASVPIGYFDCAQCGASVPFHMAITKDNKLYCPACIDPCTCEERTGGVKHDQGKNQWDSIPFECLDELAKIMTYGVNKYGAPSGWESVPNMENRYFSALMRHLSAYKQGEERDSESGHYHLSHALCNVVFLLWKELQNERQRETQEAISKL